jgi:hypothetical protein
MSIDSVINRILADPKYDIFTDKFKKSFTIKLVDAITKKECCVCYELTDRSFQCSHFACRSCILQLNSLKCPICRQEIKNISSDEKSIIESRIELLRLDREEENRLAASRTFNSEQFRLFNNEPFVITQSTTVAEIMQQLPEDQRSSPLMRLLVNAYLSLNRL